MIEGGGSISFGAAATTGDLIDNVRERILMKKPSLMWAGLAAVVLVGGCMGMDDRRGMDRRDMDHSGSSGMSSGGMGAGGTMDSSSTPRPRGVNETGPTKGSPTAR